MTFPGQQVVDRLPRLHVPFTPPRPITTSPEYSPDVLLPAVDVFFLTQSINLPPSSFEVKIGALESNGLDLVLVPDHLVGTFAIEPWENSSVFGSTLGSLPEAPYVAVGLMTKALREGRGYL